MYSKPFENMTSTIYEIILFCLYFHKPIFIIGQDWYCLLNHCLSTQRRPHARPRAMPRAVFSFTNNNPFYYKQSSAVKTIAAKFKQWLRASTYCYGGRSTHLTLLLFLGFVGYFVYNTFLQFLSIQQGHKCQHQKAVGHAKYVEEDIRLKCCFCCYPTVFGHT